LIRATAANLVVEDEPGTDEGDQAAGRAAAASRRRRVREARRRETKLVGRGGILPCPESSTTTLRSALAYPIWDGPGLLWVLLMPIPIVLTSLVTFGTIPMIAREGGIFLLFGPISFGFVVLWAAAVGYLVLILEAVITATAQGDSHHPPWPDMDLGGIVGGIGRWCLALGPTLIPAITLAFSRGFNDPKDVLLLIATCAVGLIYSLAAILAVTLHQDLFAALPGTVLPALARLGPRYIAVWVITCLVVAGMTGVVALLYQVKGFWRSVGLATVALWPLVWVLIVLARMLGLAYRGSAKRVGWFRTRRRLVIRETRTPTGA
jgi:hypothetical protein